MDKQDFQEQDFMEILTGQTHQKFHSSSSICARTLLSHPAAFLLALRLPFFEEFFTTIKAILFSKEKLAAAFFVLRVLSSLNVTSKCQWRLFSIPQCARMLRSILSGSRPIDDI